MIIKFFPRYDIKVLRFDKKSFFTTILGFSPFWDCENLRGHGNEYYSEKSGNLSIANKIPSKCDVFDGSVLNGVRQPILFRFVLDKPLGYKIVCERETKHHKKSNKSVLDTKTFYIEDANKKNLVLTEER